MIPLLRFWPKPKQQTPTPTPVPPEPPRPTPVLTDLTRKSWDADVQHTTMLRAAFAAHPILKEWLGVAWGQMPMGFPVRGQVVNDTMTAIEHGRTQGYLECLGVLQSMLEFKTPPKPPMLPTYPNTVEKTYLRT